jgi:hypothetical protein
MAKETARSILGRWSRPLIAIILGLAILQGPPPGHPGVSAASGVEIGAGLVRPGSLEAALARSQRGLRWVSRRLHFAEPLGEAVEGLLHAVGAARSSAEVDRKLELLLAKVRELEAKLAVEIDNREELARLRDLLARLSQEIRQGDPYKLCCEYQGLRLGRPLR